MSNKVPQIRFKGFDNEWEEKTFSTLMSHLPNNTLSRADLNYTQGQMQDVHYGDILVKFGEVLNVEKEKLPFFNDSSIAEKFIKATLKDGDIVIADTAEDETAGKCIEMIGVGERKISAGLHTMPCRPNQKFSPRYLGYYMNAPAYHNQLFKYMQGTKVVSISKSALAETIIRNPQKKDEQSKIGSYFEQLDALIEGKQKKLEKLKNLKKAYLDKMFPKKGAKVPEVRFKGFSDDWENQKLENYLTICDQINSNNDFGPKEVLSVSGDYGVVNQIEFQGRSFAGANLLKYRVAATGTVIYTKSPLKANPYGIIKANKGATGIVSVLYAVYNTKENANANFIQTYFEKTPRLNAYLRTLVNKGAKNTLLISDEEALQGLVAFPSVEEQTKIADFFKNLDSLISLQQQELEKLKNIKSACLQKMFV